MTKKNEINTRHANIQAGANGEEKAEATEGRNGGEGRTDGGVDQQSSATARHTTVEAGVEKRGGGEERMTAEYSLFDCKIPV